MNKQIAINCLSKINKIVLGLSNYVMYEKQSYSAEQQNIHFCQEIQQISNVFDSECKNASWNLLCPQYNPIKFEIDGWEISVTTKMK